jgi:hypothetical protein
MVFLMDLGAAEAMEVTMLTMQQHESVHGCTSRDTKKNDNSHQKIINGIGY